MIHILWPGYKIIFFSSGLGPAFWILFPERVRVASGGFGPVGRNHSAIKCPLDSSHESDSREYRFVGQNFWNVTDLLILVDHLFVISTISFIFYVFHHSRFGYKHIWVKYENEESTDFESSIFNSVQNSSLLLLKSNIDTLSMGQILLKEANSSSEPK